jgi:hypothetical protein
MRGTMMDFPLTLQHVFERNSKIFPRVEIVSRRAGPVNSAHMLGNYLSESAATFFSAD